MYKEIEDLLKDAMKIQSTPPPVTEEESLSNDDKDPLQGIEEGLEMVNSILKNTLENNFDSSSFTASRKSDIAQYLNFQSQSNLNFESPVQQKNSEDDGNFVISEQDTNPKKPSPGIHVVDEMQNDLNAFLTESREDMFEDSSSQLMESPVLKPLNTEAKDKISTAEKEDLEDIGIEPVMFTPNKDSDDCQVSEKENVDLLTPIQEVLPVQKTPLENSSAKEISSDKMQKNKYIPVEQRLLQTLKKENDTKRQLIEEIKQHELSELQEKPSINKNTEQILSKKSYSPLESSKSAKSIEDRLLERHQLNQKIRELRIKKEEEQIKTMAVPTINNSIRVEDKSPKGNIQTFISKKLDQYVKKVEYSKLDLQEKYKDKDCTFAPKINKNPKATENIVVLEDQTYGGRKGKRLNRQKYLTKKKPEEDPCTFAPAVDGNSRRIFEQIKERQINDTDVFERLNTKKHILRSKTPSKIPEEEECSFQPRINEISGYLAKKNNIDEKPPVWEQLYKLNSERKQVLEQKRLKKEQEMNQKDINCTFKPKLVSDYHFRDQRMNVYERSLQYNRNEQKIEEMKRKKLEREEKELSECTFRPRINHSGHFSHPRKPTSHYGDQNTSQTRRTRAHKNKYSTKFEPKQDNSYKKSPYSRPKPEGYSANKTPEPVSKSYQKYSPARPNQACPIPANKTLKFFQRKSQNIQQDLNPSGSLVSFKASESSKLAFINVQDGRFTKNFERKDPPEVLDVNPSIFGPPNLEALKRRVRDEISSLNTHDL
ncbi:unnamed protein product [Moneuplotes crassus]|uniref:Uncharacterized protein n=1 Tax=Euplotes crassus TaxID=5936 RepID=A0AAD1Y5U7_EUPCR|nr:unnamed protein product [Moneuplotes crassus]